MNTLTKRELEILIEASNGLDSKEIANKLFLSNHTVKFHKLNINKKLKAKNITHAVVLAIAQGLIIPQELHSDRFIVKRKIITLTTGL